MSGLPLASVQIFILFEFYNIYVRIFNKNMFHRFKYQSIVFGSSCSTFVPSFFCFLSGVIVCLVGATKGQASLFEGELAWWEFLWSWWGHFSPLLWSKLETTVKACRKRSFIRDFVSNGALILLRDCCFSVIKGGNESSLFVSLT